ncbi:citrate synthase [Pseudogracilibacillus auburnensis]|uniref:Citrate synthase n=1 Tax=Pseudogracilibacillus auburnensis TaxID=1494959 RepID=A0A2V3W707_9BACI|nr:citrate synthase [Pseudogracilibacillus auburnensis]MBO1001700.1 citrate synthase [Pseudogracilibacillus auburnensis]PXW89376.1 citrate synthase [Pseudogracilibacillus auburnensis]
MSVSFVQGLENVVVSETEISFLDTDVEKIVIRGQDLIELSSTKRYLDIVYLLLEGELPDESKRLMLQNDLSEKQTIPKELLQVFSLFSKDYHPMDAQRTGVSILANYDSYIGDNSAAMNKQRAYKLLAQLPTLTANSYRILNNQEVISPLNDLSYSANFLYMITGDIPSEEEEIIFDKSLLLYSEHEMPNSTFTARVIASTNADLYSALTGAVGSLKGNLHGGANEAVMYLLNEAGNVKQFEKILYEKLQNKEKIMGFGHRVYMKKMDPRAQIMKESLKSLCNHDGDDTLLEMCEAGETIMREEKGLFPNLDYYAAPVYWKLNIPIPLYTPIFYCSRAAGLSAHVIEQHDNNRIFRPRVNYIGKQY